jgi:hypothetical protein
MPAGASTGIQDRGKRQPGLKIQPSGDHRPPRSPGRVPVERRPSSKIGRGVSAERWSASKIARRGFLQALTGIQDRRKGFCRAVTDVQDRPVRCGAVRCGAVRCGAVRCGAVRCGAVRCGAVRCAAGRAATGAGDCVRGVGLRPSTDVVEQASAPRASGRPGPGWTPGRRQRGAEECGRVWDGVGQGRRWRAVTASSKGMTSAYLASRSKRLLSWGPPSRSAHASRTTIGRKPCWRASRAEARTHPEVE